MQVHQNITQLWTHGRIDGCGACYANVRQQYPFWINSYGLQLLGNSMQMKNDFLARPAPFPASRLHLWLQDNKPGGERRGKLRPAQTVLRNRPTTQTPAGRTVTRPALGHTLDRDKARARPHKAEKKGPGDAAAMPQKCMYASILSMSMRRCRCSMQENYVYGISYKYIAPAGSLPYGGMFLGNNLRKHSNKILKVQSEPNRPKQKPIRFISLR